MKVNKLTMELADGTILSMNELALSKFACTSKLPASEVVLTFEKQGYLTTIWTITKNSQDCRSKTDC
jgi:hypothetical protein